MHRLAIATEHDTHDVVLRRVTNLEWYEREPDILEREAAALRLCAQHDSPPAPRLIAIDARARRTDVPALLMSYVPGHIEITADALVRNIERIAAVLPRINALPVRTGAFPPYRRYRTALDHVPTWSRRPDPWRAIIEYARRPAPPNRSVFIHRDFHPGNLLWSRGRITAVIDWTNASIGAPEVDLGHCRWNLAVLGGVRLADAFLNAYLNVTQTTEHEPYWDILTLLDAGYLDFIDVTQWRAAGLATITPSQVRTRLDAYATSLAHRIAARA
jgi:aminoglycoside phosphotransferase (APT) family kinase protein